MRSPNEIFKSSHNKEVSGYISTIINQKPRSRNKIFQNPIRINQSIYLSGLYLESLIINEWIFINLCCVLVFQDTRVSTGVLIIETPNPDYFYFKCLNNINDNSINTLYLFYFIPIADNYRIF